MTLELGSHEVSLSTSDHLWTLVSQSVSMSTCFYVSTNRKHTFNPKYEWFALKPIRFIACDCYYETVISVFVTTTNVISPLCLINADVLEQFYYKL